MNKPDQNPRNPSDSSFMPPAVPPRSDAAGEREDLPEPLAPFFGRLHEIDIDGGHEDEGGTGADPSDARPASSPEGEADTGDDFPWLVPTETKGEGQKSEERNAADEPSYLGGVPEVNFDSDPDLVTFEAPGPDVEPEPEPETDAGAGQEALPAAADAASLDLAGWEAALGVPSQADEPQPEPEPAEPEPRPTEEEPWQAEPEPWRTEAEPPVPIGGDLHLEQAGGFREARSALAHEVAERLERIARSLRVRAPDDLLSGSSDPLEILIIGYVLGASHGSREPTGDQASTL